VLSRRRLLQILGGATATLSLAGLAVEVLKSIYGWKGRAGVVPLLSLSYEENIPTYYSAVILLLASAMSGVLAATGRYEKKGDAVAWWGLCAGFFYISMDEVLQFHEKWGSSLHTSGVLHFSWVIPAAGILVVLALLYAPFLLRMPAPTRSRLVLAGAIYVVGAVVLELPLGAWTEAKGEKTLGYALIDWLEETMEMAGIVLYVVTAFDVLAARGTSLRFGAPPQGKSPPAQGTSAPAQGTSPPAQGASAPPGAEEPR
jgi:hypothetical protein